MKFSKNKEYFFKKKYSGNDLIYTVGKSTEVFHAKGYETLTLQHNIQSSGPSHLRLQQAGTVSAGGATGASCLLAGLC